jgi:hypothetical protein
MRFVGKGVTKPSSKESSVDRYPLVRLPSSANTVNSIILLPHVRGVCLQRIPIQLRHSSRTVFNRASFGRDRCVA